MEMWSVLTKMDVIKNADNEIIVSCKPKDGVYKINIQSVLLLKKPKLKIGFLLVSGIGG
jgi:hypothetical protein